MNWSMMREDGTLDVEATRRRVPYNYLRAARAFVDVYGGVFRYVPYARNGNDWEQWSEVEGKYVPGAAAAVAHARVEFASMLFQTVLQLEELAGNEDWSKVKKLAVKLESTAGQKALGALLQQAYEAPE